MPDLFIWFADKVPEGGVTGKTFLTKNFMNWEGNLFSRAQRVHPDTEIRILHIQDFQIQINPKGSKKSLSICQNLSEIYKKKFLWPLFLGLY